LKCIRRPISEPADLEYMSGLVYGYPGRYLHDLDLPYRLSSWGLEDPLNSCLWFDSNEHLVAWATLQTPFWSFDLACLPELESELYPLLLAWAEQRAHQVQGTRFGVPAWFVHVFSGDTFIIQHLEQAGFACQSDLGEDSWSSVLMRRPGDAPLNSYPPPAGFIARPLAGDGEVAAYVELHQAAFQTKNMSVEWRRRTLHQPAYRPDLDIVVAAPDSRLGAFCIGWLDPQVLRGRIEPMGCHPEYRNKALGRVALAEVLRRMQALGVQTIEVETDHQRTTAFLLYESLGFKVIQEVLIYRKEFTV